MSTLDAMRDNKRQREAFNKIRLAERNYSIQLRRIARHIHDMVQAMNPHSRTDMDTLQRMLERYSDILRPWAESVGRRMLADVKRRDELAWISLARTMGIALKREILTAPTGTALHKLLDDQVDLITSLPRNAARRVHDLVTGNLYTGARAAEVAKQIMATGQVTMSRANLIARTETTRAASTLTMVRADAIGSDGYIWRTARDYNVRPTHKKMEGRYVRWDTPPEVDPGYHYHAGMFPNCFAGDTLVGPTDGTLRVLRSVYDGPLIVVVAGKTSFRVTPNHPILTLRGWTAAKDLNSSDHLVQIVQQRINAIEDDVDHRVTTSLQELYDSLVASGGQVTKTELHLHDYMLDNQVEIVGTELLLAVNAQSSASSEFVSNDMIATTNGRICGQRIMRRGAQVLKALFTGAAYQDNPALFASVQQAQPHRFALAAFRNLPSAKYPAHNADRDVELFADSSDANSAVQLYDQQRDLVRVRALPISGIDTEYTFGHVYTLETVAGIYSITPAEIAVKNCRCYPEPIIPDKF